MVAIIDYGAGNLSSVKKLLIFSARKVKLHRIRKNIICKPCYFAWGRLFWRCNGINERKRAYANSKASRKRKEFSRHLPGVATAV